MDDLKSIIIFRALNLGDMLCAVPALRALRCATDAKITLVGLPWAHVFANRYIDYIDHFIPFPGYPGLVEREPDLKAIPPFIANIQNRHYDLAIQMHGSGKFTNPLVALFGAISLIGFGQPGEVTPYPGIYLEYPDKEHEIRRLLRLLGLIGVPPAGEGLTFPLVNADCTIDVPPKCVCLHPGAGSDGRCWPLDKFATVGKYLTDAGYDVIITGSGHEYKLAESLAQSIGDRAINLAGRTTLGSLGYVLSKSNLLVCNDTGVSHLAAALKVPSVVVFHGITEIEGWPPLNRQLHRVLATYPEVSVDEVIKHAKDLLGQRHA